MYKKDLVLNDLQWLICHKTKSVNLNGNCLNFFIPEVSEIWMILWKSFFYRVYVIFFYVGVCSDDSFYNLLL